MKSIINFSVIIALLVFLTQGTGLAYTGYYNYPNSSYSSYGNGSGENYLQITQIEKGLFNRTFERESIYTRLNRIEQKLFRTTRSKDNLSQRLEAIMMNVNPSLMANVPLDDLKNLERRYLNRTYTNENVDMRVARLEQQVFGAMQRGPLDARYERLRTAVRSSNTNNSMTNYNNIPYQVPTYPTYSSGSKVKDVFANVLNGFGTITGITPPVYDQYDANFYNNYDNSVVPFQTSGHGYDQYGRTNTGSYYQNRDFGGSTGVRILN